MLVSSFTIFHLPVKDVKDVLTPSFTMKCIGSQRVTPCGERLNDVFEKNIVSNVTKQQVITSA